MTAITYRTEARVSVLRGPGSCGKTTELVRRALEAARACAEGDDAGRGVLVLAPSRTAADELGARLRARAGEGVAVVDLATAEGLAGAGAGERHGARVTVTTPRALALRVLDAPEAFAATGRRARLMTDVEGTFLLEDLLVTGKRPHRLREMLKFLERGWTELREGEDGWLVTGEEEGLQALVKDRLGLLQSLHPAEVGAACVRYLAGDADALARWGFGRVFVDDMRSMCRASQVLACMVAREGLTVTWDPDAALRGEDPYPYARGLGELLAANDGCEVVDLRVSHASAAVRGVLENLLTAPFMRDAPSVEYVRDASPRDDVPADATALPRTSSVARHVVASESDGGLVVPEAPAAGEGGRAEGQGAPAGPEVLVAPALDDEMAQVTDAVRAAMTSGAGAATLDDAARSVFVAVPGDAWALRVGRALDEAGIANSVVLARQPIGGDVRDLDRCRSARAAELLELVADEEDALAWRCWCGFGDHLTRSAAFADLAHAAADSGAGLVAELRALAGRQGAGERLAADAAQVARLAWRGQAAVERCRDLRGADLLRAVAREALAVGAPAAGAAAPDADPARDLDLDAAELAATLERLLGGVSPDEDATALAARLRDAVTCPRFAAGGVRVGGLDALIGQTPDTLVFAGMANGLIPPRAMFDLTEAMADEQDRMREQLVRRLYAACSAARTRIVCSTFAQASVEQSERLRLDTTRVRLARTGRVCDVSRSVCVDYMSGAQAIR
ncbi:MAG: DEAD/DEAH box helicase family protein [Coriobacteriales bacterium]|jgi:DNA helicase-2/ATP-dependent DNA helicase PcrA